MQYAAVWRSCRVGRQVVLGLSATGLCVSATAHHRRKKLGHCSLIDKTQFLDKKLPRSAEYQPTDSGLMFLDKTVGIGKVAEEGDVVQIHLQAVSSTTGQTVENTHNSLFANPVTFIVGKSDGKIIAAIDEGVRGMKEGGCRELLVPPRLGYPEIFSEVLIYDLQLVKVVDYNTQTSLLNKTVLGKLLSKFVVWSASRTSASYGQDSEQRKKLRDEREQLP